MQKDENRDQQQTINASNPGANLWAQQNKTRDYFTLEREATLECS